jgi:Fe-Mn family superoxide dismutase
MGDAALNGNDQEKPQMNDLDRRTALPATLTTGVMLAIQETTMAQSAVTPSASPYQPRPLPFDPAHVPGFSERILTSHHDNNYTRAANRIAPIQAQLAQLTSSSSPGFRINGLKREELLAINSMILHELYSTRSA